MIIAAESAYLCDIRVGEIFVAPSSIENLT